MSANGKGSSTARFVRKHFRAHQHHQQEQMTHLFTLYRTCELMRTELGEEGLRHWMRVNCPEIPWDDLQRLFDRARATRLQGIEQRLGRN